MLTAQDLPSGGPAYPEATPGVRPMFTPNDQLIVRTAIFNDDPAGPGPGNPAQRDPHGLAFRVNDPPLLIAEIAYAYNQAKSEKMQENAHQEGRARSRAPSSGRARGSAGLPQFADQRFDVHGGLLAAPSLPALEHRSNFPVYAVLNQTLWRIGGTDSDRGKTRWGLGLLMAAFHRAGRPRIATPTGIPMPIRDFEAAVEVTCELQLRDSWSLQPDFRFIMHPAGTWPARHLRAAPLFRTQPSSNCARS